MKKKIAIDDLRVGMYVSELDRAELVPTEFRGFWVRSRTQIDKLKRYCRHVYIDVPDSLPYPGSRRPTAGKWPSTRVRRSKNLRTSSRRRCPEVPRSDYH